MKILSKSAVLLLLILNFAFMAFGQSPAMFKYQAVLRDASGTVMANQAVSVDVSILQSDLSTSVFDETHAVTTTEQGVINLNIGSVTPMVGINWGAGEYFLRLSVNGTEMGTSQLLSVPYALYAQTAGITADLMKISYTLDYDCNNLNADGNIDVTVTGGTPPYQYEWDGGDYQRLSYEEDYILMYIQDETNDILLQVTDATGYSVSKHILFAPLHYHGANLIFPSGVGSSDGSINILVSAGRRPLTYEWSNGATTEDLVNVPAGDYTVIIRDANGCEKTATIQLYTYLNVSQTEFNLGYEESYFTFSAESNDMSGLRYTETEDWIYYDWSDGVFGQIRTYRATENTTGVVRTGYITVSSPGVPDVVVTVTQEAAPAPLAIGDLAHGGIVFYIFQPGDAGYVEGEKHGFVCAENDQSSEAYWDCSFTILGTSTDINTGAANTNTIVNNGSMVHAPLICYNLDLNGYTDWYLPSKDELNLIYVNLKTQNIGNLSNALYTSSSEYSDYGAWSQDFSNGSQHYRDKCNEPAYLRAVRTF